MPIEIVKPSPNPSPLVFSRKKRLEQVTSDLVRYASTGIAHANRNVIRFVTDDNCQHARSSRAVDVDFGHRIQCITNQIDKYLLKPVRFRDRVHTIFWLFAHQLDIAAANPGVKQKDGVGDGGADQDPFEVSWAICAQSV